MGFFHVGSSFYLGGGMLDYEKYSAHFRKILGKGEVTELQEMPTSKAYFAMTLWNEGRSLFTLGGRNTSLLALTAARSSGRLISCGLT